MLKYFIIIALVFTSIAPVVASSSLSGLVPVKSKQLNFNFSGKWTVRWLSNDSRNPLTLTQNVTKFTGLYINDAKDNCNVSGDLDTANKFIKLEVKCPKWDIQMEGFSTLDGKTIVGEYLAYGKAVGGFIMSKE